MSYILMQQSEDFECNDKIVYANNFKFFVKRKKKNLIEFNKRAKEIAVKIKFEIDLFKAQFPEPIKPNLRELSERPLVWNDSICSWQNAYVIDHDEALHKRQQLINIKLDDIINYYCNQYNISKILMVNWSEYLTEQVYFIKEI